mgnify:CR=1 FL=1
MEEQAEGEGEMRRPGRFGAGEALSVAEGWPAAASLDTLASGPGGFLVLAPHPDDESIGCGGLIAECVARGRPVRVAILSDGGASHPNSPSFPRPRLAALRQEETRAAVAELGLDPSRDVDFLGLPDAALPSSGTAFDAAVNHLLHFAKWDGYPDAVFTTWGHDPHTDHKAARAIGGALARPALAAEALRLPGLGLGLRPPHPWLPDAPRAGFVRTAPRRPPRRRPPFVRKAQSDRGAPVADHRPDRRRPRRLPPAARSARARLPAV